MNPQDLIRIARGLATGTGQLRGRPRQTELCRAVSATYYALFHTLARCAANMLVGATRRNRSQPAWRQTYRALEHRQAKNRCNSDAISAFPMAIQEFASAFVIRQRQRHIADYDPDAEFLRSDVLRFIAETEQVIAQFGKVNVKDRRAFAAYLLLPIRRD